MQRIEKNLTVEKTSRSLLDLIVVADTLPVFLVAATCADVTGECCFTKPTSFYLNTLPACED